MWVTRQRWVREEDAGDDCDVVEIGYYTDSDEPNGWVCISYRAWAN